LRATPARWRTRSAMLRARIAFAAASRRFTDGSASVRSSRANAILLRAAPLASSRGKALPGARTALRPPPAAAPIRQASQNGIPVPIASSGTRTAAAAPPANQLVPELADGMSVVPAHGTEGIRQVLGAVEDPAAGQPGEIVELAAIRLVAEGHAEHRH